ncbi:hypothetical protein CGRA01v4_01942 [Colletotrichum graminicola]|nr:hypothetical protein CGRA01v4_01942 [Colletotrichum graminicola]
MNHLVLTAGRGASRPQPVWAFWWYAVPSRSPPSPCL